MAANESAAIGDTRTIVSAQMGYASSNKGAYESLTCLEKPASCAQNSASAFQGASM